jgi:RNA polymerase sigma-70 factor (ECF subfamily)
MALPRTRFVAPADEQPDKGPPVASIDDLFRRYASDVASLGIAMLGKNDEAEDLVQDVFLRAWRGLSRLQHPELVKPWLMTIAVRAARTRLRRRRVSRLWLGVEEPDFEQIAAPGTAPDDKVLFRRLFLVLEKMPVDLRIAWVLRHIQTETVENVAALCGCSLSTAKRRINTAHERVLRKMTP